MLAVIVTTTKLLLPVSAQQKKFRLKCDYLGGKTPIRRILGVSTNFLKMLLFHFNGIAWWC